LHDSLSSVHLEVLLFFEHHAFSEGAQIWFFLKINTNVAYNEVGCFSFLVSARKVTK
jgi:hypothetical protein